MSQELKEIAELYSSGKEDEATAKFHQLVVEHSRVAYEEQLDKLNTFVSEKLAAEIQEFVTEREELRSELLNEIIRTKAIAASYTTHNEEKN